MEYDRSLEITRARVNAHAHRHVHKGTHAHACTNAGAHTRTRAHTHERAHSCTGSGAYVVTDWRVVLGTRTMRVSFLVMFTNVVTYLRQLQRAALCRNAL